MRTKIDPEKRGCRFEDENHDPDSVFLRYTAVIKLVHLFIIYVRYSTVSIL